MVKRTLSGFLKIVRNRKGELMEKRKELVEKDNQRELRYNGQKIVELQRLIAKLEREESLEGFDEIIDKKSYKKGRISMVKNLDNVVEREEE